MVMKKIIVVAALIAFSDAALAHTGLLPTDGFSHGFQHPFLGLDHFLAMLGLGLWASSQSRLLAWQAIGVFLLFMIVGALFGLAGFGFAYVETAILFSLLLVGMALSFGTVGLAKTIITLVPKLQLGNPVDEALGNCSLRCSTSCIHAVAASRDRKLELPALNSQAEAWELALTKKLILMAVTRCVRTINSHAARGNEVSFYGKAIILTSIAAFASMHGLAHGSEMPINASAYVYIAGFVSATAVLHVSGLALGWIAQRINAAGLIHIYGTMTGLIGAWLLLA
jgi:urease accessory protein